jgi:hypothetical protein
VLIIGTFSLAGDRLFTTEVRRSSYNSPRPVQQQTYRPATPPVVRASSLSQPNNTFRPAPKTPQQTSFAQREPTYHNLYGQSNERSSSSSSNDRSYDM